MVVHTLLAMRRLLLIVVLVTGVAALPFGAAARRTPSLNITRVIPLVVQGTGFASGERVRVVVRAPIAARKTVTATRRGRFSVAFRPVGKCNTVRVSAIGNKGSRASAVAPQDCGI
jgi:hypothetical protein